MDLIIKQDGGWLISFVLQKLRISETKYATKITSKLFINNPTKKYIGIFL